MHGNACLTVYEHSYTSICDAAFLEHCQYIEIDMCLRGCNVFSQSRSCERKDTGNLQRRPGGHSVPGPKSWVSRMPFLAIAPM